MSENIHVKLQFKNDYRRFIINKQTKFSELKERIVSVLGISPDFSIKYLDEESEWITMSSDVELETGLLLAEKIFRLVIELNSSLVDQIPTTSTTTSSEVKQEATTESVDDDFEGKRWRRKGKWNRNCQDKNDQEDEGEGEKCGRGGYRRNKENKWRKYQKCGRGGKGRGGKWWKNAMEGDNSSEEDDTLSLDQVKQLIGSLTDELSLMIEKKKAMKAEVGISKNSIRTARANPDADKEEILKLRSSIVEQRMKSRTLLFQIRSTKTRISKLRDIALTKTQ